MNQPSQTAGDESRPSPAERVEPSFLAVSFEGCGFSKNLISLDDIKYARGRVSSDEQDRYSVLCPFVVHAVSDGPAFAGRIEDNVSRSNGTARGRDDGQNVSISHKGSHTSTRGPEAQGVSFGQDGACHWQKIVRCYRDLVHSGNRYSSP